MRVPTETASRGGRSATEPPSLVLGRPFWVRNELPVLLLSGLAALQVLFAGEDDDEHEDENPRRKT
jgi:hypothetical protein